MDAVKSFCLKELDFGVNVPRYPEINRQEIPLAAQQLTERLISKNGIPVCLIQHLTANCLSPLPLGFLISVEGNPCRREYLH